MFATTSVIAVMVATASTAFVPELGRTVEIHFDTGITPRLGLVVVRVDVCNRCPLPLRLDNLVGVGRGFGPASGGVRIKRPHTSEFVPHELCGECWLMAKTPCVIRPGWTASFYGTLFRNLRVKFVFDKLGRYEIQGSVWLNGQQQFSRPTPMTVTTNTPEAERFLQEEADAIDTLVGEAWPNQQLRHLQESAVPVRRRMGCLPTGALADRLAARTDLAAAVDHYQRTGDPGRLKALAEKLPVPTKLGPEVDRLAVIEACIGLKLFALADTAAKERPARRQTFHEPPGVWWLAAPE